MHINKTNSIVTRLACNPIRGHLQEAKFSYKEAIGRFRITALTLTFAIK